MGNEAVDDFVIYFGSPDSDFVVANNTCLGIHSPSSPDNLD